MKTTILAAFAALVAIARVAAADPVGSKEPSAGEGARAEAEARALVATMQSDARVAWDALEQARARRRRDEVRCADESLSRVDAALRAARDDVAAIDWATGARRWAQVDAPLERVRLRAAAAHEARVTALTCSAPQAGLPTGNRTLVTLRIDPGLPPPAAATRPSAP